MMCTPIAAFICLLLPATVRGETFVAGAVDSLKTFRARYRAGLDTAVAVALRRQSLLADSLARSAPPGNPELRGALAILSDRLRGDLGQLEKDYAECDECETGRDFDDGVADFAFAADSVASLYRAASLKSAERNGAGGVRDAVPIIIESGGPGAGKPSSKIPGRSEDEEEDGEEALSTLEAGVSFDNHYAYLARDGGTAQRAVSPSLTYVHATGIYVAAGTNWLSGTQSNWDGSNLALGYRYALFGALSGSLSWTHTWYASGSKLHRAEVPNSIGADARYENGVLSPSLTLDIDIGTKTEWALTFGVEREIPLAESFQGGSMALVPAAEGTIGHQDYSLANARAVRLKELSKALRKSLKGGVDAIMEYVFTLPLQYDHDWYSIEPAISYVIPLNILGPGTSTSYLDLLLDVRVTIF